MTSNKTDRSVRGETESRIHKDGQLKVLLFDIESSPNIAYVWGKYEQNVLGDFLKERQIISFAWKWLGERGVHVLALPMLKSYKNDPGNNKELVLKLHQLISQADVLVAHNVDEFDQKMSNTEFIVHGLTPPPTRRTVDTLKVARAKFAFNSNKLDDLGSRLGLGRKVSTGGFDLWVGCLRGDLKSWSKMMKYNVNDVVLLEKIYLKLRPWMTNHPNMNVVDNHQGCPLCRSKNLSRQGWSLSNSGKAMRFKCKDCGKWSKGALVRKEWKFQ